MPISSRRLLRQRSVQQQTTLITRIPYSPSGSSSSLSSSCSWDSLESLTTEISSYEEKLSQSLQSPQHVNNSTNSAAKSVRFGSVEIRDYELVVGDHPCCSSGCPLSLGWGYATSQENVDIDQYELVRQSSRRTHLWQLKTTAAQRRERLYALEFENESSDSDSDSESAAAEKKLDGEIRHASRVQQRHRDRRLKRSQTNQFFQMPIPETVS